MNSREILRKNGKAFSWAASFLPKESIDDICDLYAFCRYVDDLVDIKNESCERVARDLYAASSHSEPVKKLIDIQNRRKIPIEPALILVNTLDKDRQGVRIKSKRELIRYSYGVASTVGLMMCAIFGVKSKQALVYSIDLGIAMQLTNIARDVYEDAKNDRIYLPQDFFNQAISHLAILSGKRDAELVAVREKVLKIADLYYQSADSGMFFLPAKVRLAIIMASRLYQAKGSVIRKNPVVYLKKRADVSLPGKIYHTLRALASFPKLSRKEDENGKEHDASLHLDLTFFPAAHSL